MMARAALMLAGLAALSLGGCSEVDFMDTLGIGKNVPDERLVATNPPLSVPPDLRLPPPGRGGADAGAAAYGDAGAGTTLTTPPGDATTAATAPANPPAGAGTAGGAATTTTAAQPATTQPANDRYAIYRKHGINPYKADGTPKSVVELNRELSAKILEEKKRRNPNYGTIFNIGSIFE